MFFQLPVHGFQLMRAHNFGLPNRVQKKTHSEFIGSFTDRVINTFIYMNVLMVNTDVAPVRKFSINPTIAASFAVWASRCTAPGQMQCSSQSRSDLSSPSPRRKFEIDEYGVSHARHCRCTRTVNNSFSTLANARWRALSRLL